MATKFVRGLVRFPALFGAIGLLGGVLICVGAVLGAQSTEPDGGSTVTVVEAKVAVTARVQCKKYEKKVLFCTVDAADAVAKNLDMRLLLGFTAVEIDGNVYEVDPIPGAEVKFVPQGDGARTDVSGTKEIRLNVVYVE
jgi:hypothetical protein